MLSHHLLKENPPMTSAREEKEDEVMKGLRLTEQIDKQPLGRFHKRMLLALGTIWMFDGYEVSLFSIVSL